MKKRKELQKLTIAALCLALCYLMPFLTGQIPEIGSMLCPMHVPVLVCGFICGWKYGLMVGLCAPVLRSAILGMPPMFPAAVCMAFELGAYGALSGIMYKIMPRKKAYIYCSLLTAMALGRVVWGIAMYICVGLSGGSFTLSAFVAGALTNAIPGIIVQIVLVPVIVMVVEKTKILSLNN